MFEANRRFFLQSVAIGAGALRNLAIIRCRQRRARRGYDVSARVGLPEDGPRKPVTRCLHGFPRQGTVRHSGGWAREITARDSDRQPISRARHLFMNAGGAP